MKKVFLIILLFLGLHTSAAIHIDVTSTLYNGKNTDIPVRKSVTIIPQVSYDGSIFAVDIPVALEEIFITIYNEYGDVVYSSASPSSASRSHTFTVTSLTDGDLYTIDVTIGSVIWTGDFIYEP